MRNPKNYNPACSTTKNRFYLPKKCLNLLRTIRFKARLPLTKKQVRVKKHGEVFTPDFLVNDMLNKLPKDSWEPNKTFCDPACGNGNFLVNILTRKLHLGHNPIDALKSIYGVDIMRDNIYECRKRLISIIKPFITKDDMPEAVYAVMRNIVWVNQKKYPNGSLDYNFSFKNEVKDEDVERWVEHVYHPEKEVTNEESSDKIIETKVVSNSADLLG